MLAPRPRRREALSRVVKVSPRSGSPGHICPPGASPPSRIALNASGVGYSLHINLDISPQYGLYSAPYREGLYRDICHRGEAL